MEEEAWGPARRRAAENQPVLTVLSAPMAGFARRAMRLPSLVIHACHLSILEAEAEAEAAGFVLAASLGYLASSRPARAA